jgi:hypothetical protein
VEYNEIQNASLCQSCSSFSATFILTFPSAPFALYASPYRSGRTVVVAKILKFPPQRARPRI